MKNEPKKMKMPKKKEKGSGGVIDLTGEDEFIKQKKKEMKEQKQALKKKKQGSQNIFNVFVPVSASARSNHIIYCYLKCKRY